MKINVLGASGQLGQKIVQALLDQGAAPEDLIASVRTVEKAAKLKEAGIEVRYADYDKPETLVEAFAGTDVLLLIPSLAMVEPRIIQHHNAVEAAKQAGVKRVAFSGLVSAAFPDSKFVITPFEQYAEIKLRQSGMAWTILRNNMYLDPVAAWMPELMEMGHLPYPLKTGRIAYVTRDDMARATAAALLNSGHENKVYALTGSYAISMPELAAAISRATGKTVVFKGASDEDYMETCQTGEEQLPEPFIQLLLTIYWAAENGEFELVTDHVERLTGRPPERIEDYLMRWAKSNL